MKTAARLFALGFALAGASVAADDWTQFRGPKRDAVSSEKNLLKSWPKEGPKLLWQSHDLGGGYGSVAVANGRIYFIGNRGLEDEFVSALDAKDGRQVWTTRLGKVGNPNQVPKYPAARSTPTLDGALLYALGSDGDLICAETATGKERWRKSLRSDFGGKTGMWAYSESPLVDGDRVIVMPGGPAAAIVALDKKSGSTLWKAAVPGDDIAGYASAIVTEIGGKRQIVQYLGKGLVGVDAATGKFLWRYAKNLDPFNVHAATPIAAGNRVYCATTNGGSLVEIKSSSEGIVAEEVYMERKAPIALGGAVKVGDHLYGATRTTLVCTEFATGKVKWEERSVGAASILVADGRLYVHGENGEMALVEATPESYREVGRFTPPSTPDRGISKAWNYPVISGGRLYIRDLGSLWVYDIRE